MRDLALGGVFFPGLLIVGLIFSARGPGRLPCRPLWGLSLFIALFFLLLQGVHTLGLSV
ncbi:DUF1656 domain-containing protein [Klebsiella quasipneumoniae]|uniref:DUF1656 domain-containing protein n=1 Tax=Klebsiella quasipneumoniae TaxID=1463165 RepID=UPI003ECA5D23